MLGKNLKRRTSTKTIKGRLEMEKKEGDSDELKTAEMFRLERRHGKGIEELLIDGTGIEVAKKLGITTSCVSIWRRRLGIVHG